MQRDTKLSKYVKTRIREIVEVEVDWEGVADAVEVLVLKKLGKDMEDWAEDRGMRAMFLGDAGDGLAVCELIAEGKWNKVYDRLWKMDTAAREHVYDFIEQVAGADFFKLMQEQA